MQTRNLDAKAFRSKVARRTFVLFIVCALIPVSALAVVSFEQVTTQLRDQSERRLHQANKAVAMVLYKRLLALEAAMKARVPDDGSDAGLPRPFKSLVLVTEDGQRAPLFGAIAHLPALTAAERRHLASGKTLLSVQAPLDGVPRLLMGRAVNRRDREPGILWGEINPAYLWGFDDEPALPSTTQLSVVDQSRRLLFSSFQGAPAIPEPVVLQMSRGTSGQFEWGDDTNEYVANYWSLFLEFKFRTPTWTVVVSQSKADIFAPMNAFTRTFLLVTLMTVWIVLLLSISQIRRSLIPLETLKEGTRRIAMGDFDSRVEVASRDEFQNLAVSFNRMARQLGRHFSVLAMRGEVSATLNRNRKLEETLQQCAEVLVQHLDLALACIWILDGDGTTLDLQASAGTSRRVDETHRRIAVGRSEIGLIAEERRPHATNSVLEDARTSDKEWAAREGIVAFVGQPLLVADQLVGVAAAFAREPLGGVELSAFASAAGEIAQCIERKRVEEALHGSEEQIRQLQKMEAVGRLAGGIAHDFNNLLTVIAGHTQLLLRELAADHPLRRGIELIEATAERAAGLTRQLLTFSRKQVLAVAVLDLNDVVSNMTEMVQRLIGENVDLVWSLDPELGRVKVDPGQLEQVIVNLLVNARDAVPNGGRITLETANVELSGDPPRQHVSITPGSYVMLAVTDTGTGMDPETKSHIFEPFFTTKEPGKGTGLGLATVYGVVRQSGGSIEVDSEPGEGSTFKIYFPRVENVPEKREVESLPPAGGSETLLVVDDENEVRAIVQRILEDYGYVVLSAGKITDALRIAELHPGPVHLLVTDVVMPQMSGPELAERLVSLRPQLAVLYMSGYTEHQMVNDGQAGGEIPFIQKPFTADALARKVRAILDSKAHQDTRRRDTPA